jgi:predicted permease
MSWLDDILFAVRLLRRAPLFATAAVLTLALGIGVNSAVFSVVNAMVLRPLPVRDAGRLVVVATRHSSSLTLGGVSFPDLQDYREATPEIFEDIAAYSVGFVGLRAEGGRPERVLVSWVTGNYFPLLDIPPAVGRLIHKGEGGSSGTDPVVVLGYSSWQRRFGGDRSVVGRAVLVNGRSCTIVGVAPPDFAGTFAFSDSEIYLPLNWNGGGGLENRDGRGLHALARLRPGMTIEHAQAAMNVVANRLARRHPDTNGDVTVTVVPERFARPEEDQARSNARVATIMLALVGLVLLVAAVNVGNLLLARSTARRKELAIRAALGAGRGRLARQLITESLTLAVFGGAAGLVLGTWAGRLLGAVRPPGDLPVRFDFRFDGPVLAYTAIVIVLTGLFAGLLPALRASRADLDGTLRESGNRSQANGPHRFRSAIVVAQVTASFVLLIAAGLFTRSLTQAERVDFGFEPERVLNIQMDVGQLDYTEARGRAFFDDVERRARAIPGVDDLSYAFTVPMGYVTVRDRLYAEGHSTAGDPPLFAGKNIVGPGYFATMGIPVVGGRSFGDDDDIRSRKVAIVNERLAGMLWPGRDPIGRRFSSTGPDGPWVEVVGVTRTGKYRFLFEDPQPYFYVPILQEYTGLRVLHARTSMSPEALAPALERIIREREPDLPLYDVQSMAQALGGGFGLFLVRLAAIGAAIFGTLGLGLVVIGVYGVVSYMANQRSHEVAVRMALGATTRDILWLVLHDGLRLVSLGLAIGLSIALVFSQSISGFLFGISARDPLAFAGVAGFVGCVASVACIIPALRAARVDPMITLRSA